MNPRKLFYIKIFLLQPGNIRSPQQPLTILAIDTEAAEGDPESGLLGTDFMFFTSFLGEIFFYLYIHFNIF